MEVENSNPRDVGESGEGGRAKGGLSVGGLPPRPISTPLTTPNSSPIKASLGVSDELGSSDGERDEDKISRGEEEVVDGTAYGDYYLQVEDGGSLRDQGGELEYTRRALAASRGQCAALTRTVAGLREEVGAARASLARLQRGVSDMVRMRGEAESRAATAEAHLLNSETRWRQGEARAEEAEARLLALRDAEMAQSGEFARAVGDARADAERGMAEEVAKAQIAVARERSRAEGALARELVSSKKAASYKKKLLTLYGQYCTLKAQLSEAEARGTALAGDLKAAVRDARLAAREKA